MDEKNLFSDYPTPVEPGYFEFLRVKIERRHRRGAVLRNLTFASGLAAALLVGFFLVFTPADNPGEMQSLTSTARVEPAFTAPPSAPGAESRESETYLDPVDFQIARTNGNIQLVWDADPGIDYIVKKCSITRTGFDCRDEKKVQGSVYTEPAEETTSLIVYRVFAEHS